jgi:hypothetical protein
MALTEAQKAERAAKRQITKALKEEARAHRDEARRQEWRDKDMYLTRAQAFAGEPCRGCGLPVIDNLGSWPGTMYLTPEERVEYDAAEARYREMHPDCDAHRWSMAGSRATHCGYCCPPIPMSREQAEDIGRLLASFGKPREEELDIWQRTLTCGHVVKQSVHHTNHGPSFSTQWCPACEVTRGVVSSEKTIEAATRIAEAKRKREDQVKRAEREVAKAEKAAREAKRKLEELRARGS